MDPRTALDQARRVEGLVRRQGRWNGWAWLTIGVATPVFLITTTTEAIPGPAQLWIAIGFMTLAGGLAILETRRGVWGREASRADRPMTTVYVVTMVAVAMLLLIFDPWELPGWFVFAALVPSVPCFIAAWRILKR